MHDVRMVEIDSDSNMCIDCQYLKSALQPLHHPFPKHQLTSTGSSYLYSNRLGAPTVQMTQFSTTE